MNFISTPRVGLAILASLMFLALVSGCSQDQIAGPADEQSSVTVTTLDIAEDPLADVLKSTDGYTPPEPQDRYARLAEVLGLDDDQVVALVAAFTEFRDGIAELRTFVQDGEMTLVEAREAAVILRESFEAEMLIILTEDQWAILQEMREGRPPRIPNHHNQGAHVCWNDWLTEIEADEDQNTAVFAALDILLTSIRDLRVQVREGTLTNAEAREAATILRAEFEETLQTILTEEQYEALLALRPDCLGRGNNA